MLYKVLCNAYAAQVTKSASCKFLVDLSRVVETN